MLAAEIVDKSVCYLIEPWDHQVLTLEKYYACVKFCYKIATHNQTSYRIPEEIFQIVSKFVKFRKICTKGINNPLLYSSYDFSISSCIGSESVLLLNRALHWMK